MGRLLQIVKRLRGRGDVRRVMTFIETQERVASELRTSELDEYRRIVRDLPRPSEEQIEGFVQFVSEAHSWYKHLPLLSPGKPFQFFIDPCSGFERYFEPDGRVVHVERVEGDTPFHYTCP